MSGSVILIRQDTGERIALDAVPSFSVLRSWRPTESPVEATANAPAITLTDQIQRMPIAVSLDVTMTQSPPNDGGTLGRGVARLAAFIAWIENVQGVLLTLILPNRPTMRDLVIVTFPDEGDLYEHLRCRLALTEVHIVETGTVDIPARQVKASARAGLAPTADNGPAPTAPVPPQQQSLFLSLFGGAL